MKIKHDDIVIDNEQPFKNCRLGRKIYADTLTKIVDSYKDGFVLAINSEWGTGKTTFVKMWQHQLKLQQYHTIYFNAWENDFETNPLVAIIAEFKALTKTNTDTYKSLIAKGAVITKHILPDLIKAFAKQYIDVDAITDILDNATKSATEIFEEEVKEYTKKKDGIKEFKISLKKFVEESADGKPVIFIIDELDRCRPNYAVELLEQIKHLFAVPGIVFVLSIDKIQLGHAVRGVYGSDLINADEYLRRFIDLEFSIPLPNTKDFCNYLFEYFEFSLFFNSEERKKYDEFKVEKKNILDISATLFEKSNISLRQQEKVFAHARMALLFFNNNNYLFPELFLILVFFKNFKIEFYNKIKLKSFTIEELLGQFAALIPKGIDVEKIREFIKIEASLAFFYNNSFSEYGYNSLIKVDEEQKENLRITSALETSANPNVFFNALKRLDQNSDIRRIEMDYLLNRIDFSENLNINN